MPNEAEIRAQDEKVERRAQEEKERWLEEKRKQREVEEEKQRLIIEEENRKRLGLNGKTLRGKFHVIGDVAQGGFGRVYKAEDCDLRDLVAIKELHLDDPESLIEEARVLSRLRHQNIVGFRELFRNSEGEGWLMVMDFVDGMSLEEMIRSRQLYAGGLGKAYPRMISLVMQFAEALAHAHDPKQGRVIHQDVKPGNVLVSRNETAMLSDFGLAKARPVRNIQDGAYQYAVTGKGIMSIHYCSPEQHRGDKLTTKTDSWSWAVSCLEMFNGGVTWEFGVLAERVLDDYVRNGPRSDLIPKMPKPVVNLLRACFSRDPQNRPGMNQILSTLEPMQPGETGNWLARLFK